MNFDPVELQTNSFGGNRTVEVHIEFRIRIRIILQFYNKVGQLWLYSMYFVYNSGYHLEIRFGQIPLVSTVIPVGCGSHQ